MTRSRWRHFRSPSRISARRQNDAVAGEARERWRQAQASRLSRKSVKRSRWGCGSVSCKRAAQARSPERVEQVMCKDANPSLPIRDGGRSLMHRCSRMMHKSDLVRKRAYRRRHAAVSQPHLLSPPTLSSCLVPANRCGGPARLLRAGHITRVLDEVSVGAWNSRLLRGCGDVGAS